MTSIKSCTCTDLVEIGDHMTDIVDNKAILYKTYLCKQCLTVKVKKYNVQYESEMSFS